MKLRTILGIGILIFFLAGGLLSSRFMERTCTPISKLLNQAAENTDPKLAQKAKNLWDSCHHGIATLADHTPMDEVDGLFRELRIYGRLQEMPHFTALCAHIQECIQSFRESHQLSWWNLLLYRYSGQ